MNVAFQRNIGSFLRAALGFAAQTITAGQAEDGAAQDGVTLDRNAFEPLCLSAMFVLTAVAALNDGVDTAELSVAFQDSADGVNWDAYDAGPPEAPAAVTIAEDGTTVHTFKAQLGGARRYVRARPTVSLSRANTDTVAISGVWIIGGADTLPIEDYVEAGTSS